MSRLLKHLTKLTTQHLLGLNIKTLLKQQERIQNTNTSSKPRLICSGLTVVLLLIILPGTLHTKILTRTSKSYSIVRRVRGKVSSSSFSSSSSFTSTTTPSPSYSEDKNLTAGGSYVDSYTFRRRLLSTLLWTDNRLKRENWFSISSYK